MERAGAVMRVVKGVLFLVIFMLLAGSASADGNYKNRLTGQEIERVKALKELLVGVDTQPMWKTIDELERSRHPLVNIEMKEAAAKTYIDIIQEFKVESQRKKWLYSMVCLNMAYLQFGGSQGNPGSATELNRLIRQKIKEYLPANILKQPGFIYSLE